MKLEMNTLFIYTTVSLFVFSRLMTLINVNKRKQSRVTFEDEETDDEIENNIETYLNKDELYLLFMEVYPDYKILQRVITYVIDIKKNPIMNDSSIKNIKSETRLDAEKETQITTCVITFTFNNNPTKNDITYKRAFVVS